ncbi:MAG: glycoside hydrolase family 125 protein [Ignavibacteriaceae bacterium]|nr:glycoside hydrolase family 125 protein [Ignavibacteriaceae bacterium]
MISRRKFIKSTGLILASSVLGKEAMAYKISSASENEFPSLRPKPEDRKFISEAVEETIAQVKSQIYDKELAWLFENCFPNTLDTTVNFRVVNQKPDTFVITGDIEAMWLRDSSAQVWPYLNLCSKDEKLKQLIAGVINRQTDCILIDPYANAFNFTASGTGWQDDFTEMKPELHERKWEIDSLCYPLRLAYGYWKAAKDISVFDDKWKKASSLILQTFGEQQSDKFSSNYSFQRKTRNATDTLPLAGFGNPSNPCGLINSSFRPSDDACIFSFLIPSNLFAAVSLNQMAEILLSVYNDRELADRCTKMSEQIRQAVIKLAVHNSDYGKIFAYEVDGFGSSLLMDDANVPNLISLPYLSCVMEKDDIYLSTRKFILSESNPFFFKGNNFEGVGSPHTGMQKIWPLSIIMRALTSDDDQEIIICLKMLKQSHAGTGFMHESFHKNDPKNFSRAWFAWANTLFGELILKIYNDNPRLLKMDFTN